MSLEYAQFQDYRIRDNIYSIIKALEADLDEVGFEASPSTKKTLDELESLITDIETERAPKPAPIDFSEEDVPVKEVHRTEADDEIEASVRRVKSVDDELDEFEQEVAHPKKKT